MQNKSHLPVTLYQNKQAIVFNEGNFFARGGEGTIHDLKPEIGKVYLPDRLDDERREKLHLLHRNSSRYPGNVAAPLALLKNVSGVIEGYLMEKKDGLLLAELLADPKNQTKEGSTYLLELFVDILETLDTLHEKRVIVGDLNPNNIICGQSASFIDFDSVQVQGYRCIVKMDRYTDPSVLQYIETGHQSPDPLFSRETDWYAFATLLFEALMGGHPRTGVAEDPAIPKKLAKRLIEGKHWVGSKGISPPRGIQPSSWLHPELLEWFRTYFTTMRRPKPTIAMLQEQIKHIGGTPRIRRHRVHPELRNHSNLTGDKSAVWGDASRLGGDVSNLKGDVTNISGHIAIRGTVNGLRGNINSITGDCSRISGDCSRISGNVSGLIGDVSRISGDVTKIRGEIRVTGDVSPLEGDISLIWGDITPTYRIGGVATGYSGDITGKAGLLDAIKQFQRTTHYFGKPK